VKPTERLLVVGGGNVGLIAGYHALQAGIDVVGLVEALPQCSGYQVHADKIKRLGVPIYTRHTILSANGKEHVESVTVSEIDSHIRTIPGTERTYECDTVLIAVGLGPVNEFYREAEQSGIKAFSAGDAKEIAEASSAMFNGKIAAFEIARALGREDEPIPKEWYQKANVLKSPPGPTATPSYDSFPEADITPVFHCAQEIPCNPCVSVTDFEGTPLQEAVVIDTVINKASRKTQIIKVRVPKEIAKRVAGFKIQRDEVTVPKDKITRDKIPDDAIVCWCERVTAGEIRTWIRKGIRDLNQIKAITRAGMGACGSKTCGDLILQLFKEEGVPLEELTLHTLRPLFIEAPLGIFSNISYGSNHE